MTAVFCHNAADRKAETWKKELDPFSRLEFAVSDAARGIAAAVEQVAAGRHGEAEAEPKPMLGHGLDVFHNGAGGASRPGPSLASRRGRLGRGPGRRYAGRPSPRAGC